MTANPIVSICCITYNHQDFISEAIDGFLAQKTNFPYEIVIGDDCSEDSTQSIIHRYSIRYPNIIKVLSADHNLGVIKNLTSTLAVCTGKYIALCEGDDYWTDPYKLQKQVDFMEAHPECSICTHKVLFTHENGDEKNKVFPEINGDQVFTKSYLYGHYFIQTCSVLFKNENISEFINFLDGFKVGDAPLYYFYSQNGNIGFIDECMAVYRFHNTSFWSSQDNFSKHIKSIKTLRLLQKKLNIYHSSEFDQHILDYLIVILNHFYRERDRFRFIQYLGLSVRYIEGANDKQKEKLKNLFLKFLFPRNTLISRLFYKIFG